MNGNEYLHCENWYLHSRLARFFHATAASCAVDVSALVARWGGAWDKDAELSVESPPVLQGCDSTNIRRVAVKTVRKSGDATNRRTGGDSMINSASFSQIFFCVINAEILNYARNRGCVVLENMVYYNRVPGW